MNFRNAVIQDKLLYMTQEEIIEYCNQVFVYDKDFDGYGHSRMRPVLTREELVSFAKHFYGLALSDMKKEILAKYQKDVNPAIVNSADNEQIMFNVGQARGIVDIIKLIKQLAENE